MPVEPSERAPKAPAIVYVCPQCWRRVEVCIALDDPPHCDPCSERMTLYKMPKDAADPAPAACSVPLEAVLDLAE